MYKLCIMLFLLTATSNPIIASIIEIIIKAFHDVKKLYEKKRNIRYKNICDNSIYFYY